VTFDTFSTNGAVVIEVEDYNHDAGQFIDNPVPGAFAGLTGVPETDYHSVSSAGNTFRPSDPQDIFVSLETRPYFIAAGVPNYALGGWDVENWQNYTRTFPNADYQVYLRYGGLVDQSLQLDLVTGDRTQPNQTKVVVGMLNAPQINSTAIYRYAELTDTNGVPITVHLSGVQTIRLTGSNVNPDVLIADFFVLVPLLAEQPQLSISLKPGQVTLSFPTQSGKTYTLEYKDHLSDSGWQSILPSINGDGTVKSIDQPVSQPSRFYRLAMQ
jgi:hypothetical protein